MVETCENRRHVSTYNTLEETHGLLEKEVSLIQSVNDSFQQAMQSKAGKEQFLDQMKVSGGDTPLSMLKHQLPLTPVLSPFVTKGHPGLAQGQPEQDGVPPGRGPRGAGPQAGPTAPF